MLTNIRKLFQIGLLIFVCAILFVIGQERFTNIRTTKVYVILSGSMEPSVPVGSVVFVHSMPFYYIGDVISFSPSGSNDDIVTHRITQRKENGVYFGVNRYITKGDANKSPDPTPLQDANIKGKVFMTVPYLGYVVDFSKTTKGFILFIVIPSTIIIYEELKSVRRELAQQIKHILLGIRPIQEISKAGQTKRKLPLAFHYLIFIPMFGALCIIVSVSVSYFLDLETSAGNIFGAASSFETKRSVPPTLTPVLIPPTPMGSPSGTTTIYLNTVEKIEDGISN